MPHLCSQSHSHALSRLLCSPPPYLTVAIPREGVGVALGAQVGYVVTCRGSPEGSLIYTVFTKRCQKRSKMGYPLFLGGRRYSALRCLSARWCFFISKNTTGHCTCQPAGCPIFWGVGKLCVMGPNVNRCCNGMDCVTSLTHTPHSPQCRSF